MRIFYRPQRGGLAESMAELQEFSSIKELFEYLVKDNNNAFDEDQVYISYYGCDHRIGWDTFIVTVERYFDENYLEKYGYPQAIGFCTFVKSGAVDIIRCKDCKYKVETAEAGYNPHDIVCAYHSGDGFDETDFCSFAVRGKYEEDEK
jgi:hypothetical protein